MEITDKVCYFLSVPTILTEGGYRLFFYADEGFEPAHVHVQRDRSFGKFWLQPVGLVSSHGFAAHELRELHGIVRDNSARYLEKWNEHLRKST